MSGDGEITILGGGTETIVGQPYLVAQRFDLADLCYIPSLEFLPLMEITPLAAVAAWRERGGDEAGV